MERDPQTDYEFLLWNQANHLTAIVSSLLDALKVSVGLLALAKATLPDDLGLDNVLENFKRVIAAGEKVEKRLGIDMSCDN